MRLELRHFITQEPDLAVCAESSSATGARPRPKARTAAALSPGTPRRPADLLVRGRAFR
jgi:hypothetical protein